MSTVPAAPSIKYVLGYRSRTLTLNPNPITDPNPNPKINKKQNDTGMKLKNAGIFVPKTIRSLEHSFPGPFVPETEYYAENSFP